MTCPDFSFHMDTFWTPGPVPVRLEPLKKIDINYQEMFLIVNERVETFFLDPPPNRYGGFFLIKINIMTS